ncbi:4675_t:CDS:2 [Diversispora eburnea]|uniref:4675_t:CDS:1 n=1 Tax=Diversispora eburnea TaxID=1213867 RepID=A0A9N8YRI8_9GLOM|nr:4675_t:CDS:2 [Diversispora eburnea]
MNFSIPPISEVLIKERSKGKEVVVGRDERIEESRRKVLEEANELIRAREVEGGNDNNNVGRKIAKISTNVQ